MKLSEQAAAASGLNLRRHAEAEPVKVWPSDLDDYSGVILSDGVHHLAISQKGNAYLAQHRQDGVWVTRRPFLTLGELAFHIEIIDGPWPDQFLAALDGLPRDPRDYERGSV